MTGIAFVETYLYARVKWFIQMTSIDSLENERFGENITNKKLTLL